MAKVFPNTAAGFSPASGPGTADVQMEVPLFSFPPGNQHGTHSGSQRPLRKLRDEHLVLGGPSNARQVPHFVWLPPFPALGAAGCAPLIGNGLSVARSVRAPFGNFFSSNAANSANGAVLPVSILY